MTAPGDELSTNNGRLPQSTVGGCQNPPDPGMVTGMYEVSVTTRTTAVGPVPCAGIDEAVDVLLERVITAMTPGRRVTWVIRCPAGRVVRGDITINNPADRRAAVDDHIIFVRGVLLGEHRAPDEISPPTEGV